jgi:hypothetical protein
LPFNPAGDHRPVESFEIRYSLFGILLFRPCLLPILALVSDNEGRRTSESLDAQSGNFRLS